MPVTQEKTHTHDRMYKKIITMKSFTYVLLAKPHLPARR